MIRENRRIALAQLLDEPCRTLDVGEEERDGAGRNLGHAAQAWTVIVRKARGSTSRVASGRAAIVGRDVSARPVPTQYEDFVRHVVSTGMPKGDRTGTGTVSVFGYQMRFDLSEGFPLVTTKKVHFRSDRRRAPLVPARRLERPLAAGARRDDLGRVGRRRRRARARLRRPVAQLADAGGRPRRPDRRGRPPPPRGPGLASDRRQRLERRGHPAHGPRARATLSSSSTSRGERLSCQIYQRSADVFLGVPFNIASYALLTHMLAQQSDLELGDLVWTGGDCHIYDNHREQVETLLSRDPYPYPSLRLRRRPDVDLRLRVRGLRGGRLPAPSGDPRAGRRVTVALVAAVARDGVIGRDGGIPWHIPEDVAHFKALTTGHAVVMGRKTWDSLPERFRPLPGRRNVVVTRDPEWNAAGAERAGSVEEALEALRDVDRVFVIGGAEIYAAALPFADELVLTEVDLDVDGDTFFPEWDRNGFVEVSREERAAEDGTRFAFVRCVSVGAA